MRKVFPLLLSAILAMAAASCEKEIPILEVSPQSINVDKDGGEYTFTVHSNNAWKASASAAWLNLSPISSDGSVESVTVKVRVDPNSDYDTRSCLITVRSGDLSAQVDVSQGEKMGMTLTQGLHRLTSAEQSLLIQFSTNISYSVIIPDNCKSWIKLLETKALKATSVTLMISRNDTYDSREGTVVIRGETGVEIPLSIIQSPTDAILMSEHHYDLTYEEQTLELKYSTNMNPGDYEIVISEEAREWIVPAKTQTKAMREETAVFLIRENSSVEKARGGMITFRSKDGEISENVTVSQDVMKDVLRSSLNRIMIPGEDFMFTLPLAADMDFEYYVDAGDDWLTRLETRSVTEYKLSFAAKANLTESPRDGVIRFQSSDGMHSDAVNVRQLPLGKGIIGIAFNGKRAPEAIMGGKMSWQYHWDDGTFNPINETIEDQYDYYQEKEEMKSYDDGGPHSYRLMFEGPGNIEFEIADINLIDLRQY